MIYGQKTILMYFGIWLQINDLLKVLLLSVKIQEFKLPSPMLREGLFSKACQALLSSGLAPNNKATWNLLVSKHPKSPLPSPPSAPSAPLLLPPDSDLKAILLSFPKGTACGPSGLCIQHLIEVAGILQSPICAVLRDIVNLLLLRFPFQWQSLWLAVILWLWRRKSQIVPSMFAQLLLAKL